LNFIIEYINDQMTAMDTKTISIIRRAGEAHWVGDGFPVRTVFHYEELGAELSPFLLLDHAGPADFPPAGESLGVGWHPHRGFETVTIAFDGAVDHEDTAGNRGSISPGDVQWMTAGSGLLHKEMHGADFARRGGRFEMLQLWVNLPARSKMVAPRYQTLLARDIPVVPSPGGEGSVRVIAGEFAGTKGPAQTTTPIDLFDVRLRPEGSVNLGLRDGLTAGIYVVKGEITANGTETARAGELLVLGRAGAGASIRASSAATLLVMSGQPIEEPIAGSGPFVMNTAQQIEQAYRDFRAGRLGRIPEPTT
jgi:redox-sensitive bicupin YhaK (pirin superfamily)